MKVSLTGVHGGVVVSTRPAAKMPWFESLHVLPVHVTVQRRGLTGSLNYMYY